MGASRRSFLRFFPGLFLVCAGCGGAGSPAIVQPPPPPSPDFAITFSTSSLSIAQGTSAPITVSMNGQHGFSGSVQISFAAVHADDLIRPQDAPGSRVPGADRTTSKKNPAYAGLSVACSCVEECFYFCPALRGIRRTLQPHSRSTLY